MKINSRILLILCFVGSSLLAISQTEPNTFTYEDVAGNTIKLMDVAALPNEMDTSFFKNSFDGLLFSDSTQNMYINILEITRQKKGTYDVRLTLVEKGASIEQIIAEFGYKHYILVYKKSEIIRFEYWNSEI